MKVYRTDRNGVGVLKLSGVVSRNDCTMLIRCMCGNEDCVRGCFILDFEEVTHVDFRVFELLEKVCANGAKILLSGLNDYLINILAFISSDRYLPVYPDWRKALQQLVAERGRLNASPA